MNPNILLLALMLASGANAQLYLHDARRDAEAKRAMQQFTDAVGKDGGLFSTMLANVDAVHERNIAQLRSLNETAFTAFLNNLPAWTWGQLLEDLGKQQTQFLVLRDSALLRIGELETAIGVTAAQQADLGERVREMEKRVAERRATLAVARPKLRDFEEKLQEFDAQGLKPDFESLQRVISGEDVLKDLESMVRTLATAPPGIEPIILDARLQLQKLELEREGTKLAHYADQLRLEAGRIRDLERVVGRGLKDPSGNLLGPGFGTLRAQIQPGNSGRNAFCANQRDLILVTLRGLADGAAKEPNGKVEADANCPESKRIPVELQYTMRLRNLVDVLDQVTAVNGIETFLAYSADLERATAEQRHALHLSAITARGREALISHGLEGLSAYYAGGWKPEDTANLLRTLQTAAQATIGARIR